MGEFLKIVEPIQSGSSVSADKLAGQESGLVSGESVGSVEERLSSLPPEMQANCARVYDRVLKQRRRTQRAN